MHWQNGNGDFGPNPNDLQAIIVEASSTEAANRQYGELTRPAAGFPDGLGDPTLIGTVIVQRTLDVPSSISITPIAGMPWGSYIANATGSGIPTSHSASSFSGGTALVPVPEPATLTLATLALLALLARRRCASSELLPDVLAQGAVPESLAAIDSLCRPFSWGHNTLGIGRGDMPPRAPRV